MKKFPKRYENDLKKTWEILKKTNDGDKLSEKKRGKKTDIDNKLFN